MSLSLSDARTRIRTITGLDASQQVTDTQIDGFVDEEYRRVLRELAGIAPTALNTSTQSYSTTTGILAKPATFLALVELEHVDASGNLVPVVAGDGDKGRAITVSKDFRLTFVTSPASGYTTLTLPDGLEAVVVQRAAAQVQIRRKQDPAPHAKIADEQWGVHARHLRRRYGRNVQDGLRSVLDAPFAYLERGSDLVVVETAVGWGW